MQEVKLTKAAGLKVILDTGEYKVRRPTIGESRDLQDRLIEDKDRTIDLMVSFLDGLGLPKEVAEGLDHEEMETLLSVLIPPKKKEA